MNRETQKEEAVKRLEILKSKGLMPCVKRAFDTKKQTIYYSEFNGLGGALYFFNETGGAKQEWIDLVKKFEEDYGALVYHITHEYTSFGELLDLFFVSKYEEEWNYDRNDLYNGYSYAYVINLSEPSFSEFGTIGYKTFGGGLIRTI